MYILCIYTKIFLAIFKNTDNCLGSVLISIQSVVSINSHTPGKHKYFVQCSFKSVQKS